MVQVTHPPLQMIHLLYLLLKDFEVLRYFDENNFPKDKPILHGVQHVHELLFVVVLLFGIRILVYFPLVIISKVRHSSFQTTQLPR